jgi:hypothetical protein
MMQTFRLRKNFAPLILATAVILLPFVVTLAAPDPEIWLAWVICGSLAALLVFGYLCSGVSLDSKSMRIRADIYWKTFFYTDIINANVIDLKLEPALHAQWRTFGTSLPRYHVGDFQLSNAEKGFLFVTDDQNVIHLQTKDNIHILLCFADNQKFLDALEVARANA